MHSPQSHHKRRTAAPPTSAQNAAPHDLDGLRHAFADEHRGGAHRRVLAGFTRDGAAPCTERVTGTLDEDRGMRVAAVQAPGQQKIAAC